MKAIFTFLILTVFVFASSIGQPTWQSISSPVNEDLISLFFLDESNGWIISTAGTILSTNDGGENWTAQSFPDYHFEGVYFSTADQGYIVGWYGILTDSSLILQTSDGGSSWSEAYHPNINRLNDVFFASDLVGWAVGSKDELNLNCCLYTDDGGQNWNATMDIFVASAELFAVHFRDAQNGVVCGANGAFFQTNNGGLSGWALNVSMPLVNLNDVYNMGDLYGCAVGDDGTILYTVNNWYQYIDQNSGTQEDMNAVHAEPVLNKVWAVGNNGTILYSPSYILGWTDQSSGTTENLNDVYMHSETNGWAVGDNGIILRYSDATSIMEIEENVMTVFPNPGNGLFVLQLDQKYSMDRIEIMDIFGRIIKSILPEDKIEELTIDISEFQQGIYFLKVYSSQHSFLQRVVINQ